MEDRWDFYEITFSVDGDQRSALTVFEEVEKIEGVRGAAFSAGNYAPHPFSKASVEKAARKLAEMWPGDFDPAERGTFNNHALEVVNTVLTAATNPSVASDEQRHGHWPPFGGDGQDIPDAPREEEQRRG